MSVAAVALAASGIAVIFAMPASAAAGPHGKVTCTRMSGSTTSGFITISGCSGTAVPGTGGSSQPISIAVLAGGGNVTWVSGAVTHFAKPVLGSASAKHCPGYVKGSSTNPALTKFAGGVTSDNSGMKVPGKYKGEVCISHAGNFSAPKAFKVN